MQALKNFKNPLIWVLGLVIKTTIRKLFFKNIANDDFKKLFSYTLELLPSETFIGIVKLFINIFISKPSDILNLSLLNEAVTHSIPTEQRLDMLSRLRFLFLFLMLSNIFKRTLFIIKNLIILPFKLGVYGFIASLFGLRPDYLLSFFDVFKFNLPGWTYNKLVELHLSWMSWFKNTLQINSINTDLEKPLTIPKIKNPYLNVEPVIESKEETYLYLTKKQWFYLSITILTALGAYFGYTGGIPFKQAIEWNGDFKPETNHEGKDVNIKDWEGMDKKTKEAKWKETHDYFTAAEPSWYDTIKSWPGKIIEKINPFNWWRTTDEIGPEELQDKKKLDHFRKEEETQVAKHKRRLLGKYWYEHDNITDNNKLEPQKTSPTHPDPEIAKDRDRLFPKSEEPFISKSSVEPLNLKENSTQVHNPARPSISSLYSVSEANESTETVTQSNVWSGVKGNSFQNIFEDSIPSDITASELQPLTRPDSDSSDSDGQPLTRSDSSSSDSDGGLHTYPPRPKGKEKVITYFPGGDNLEEGLPIARGFSEDIKIEKINRGSIMFSSNFLDHFKGGRNK